MSHSIYVKHYGMVHVLPVCRDCKDDDVTSGWAGGHAGSVFLGIQEPKVTAANGCLQSHSGLSNDKSIKEPIVSARVNVKFESGIGNSSRQTS